MHVECHSTNTLPLSDAAASPRDVCMTRREMTGCRCRHFGSRVLPCTRPTGGLHEGRWVAEAEKGAGGLSLEGHAGASSSPLPPQADSCPAVQGIKEQSPLAGGATDCRRCGLARGGELPAVRTSLLNNYTRASVTYQQNEVRFEGQ